MGEELQKSIKKTCDTNLHTELLHINVHRHTHTNIQMSVLLNENANIMCFFPQFILPINKDGAYHIHMHGWQIRLKT